MAEGSRRVDDSREGGIEPCAGCGAEVCPARDLSFVFGRRAVLCGDCAFRRGGRYDVERDRWETLPDYRDLADELH